MVLALRYVSPGSWGESHEEQVAIHEVIESELEDAGVDGDVYVDFNEDQEFVAARSEAGEDVSEIVRTALASIGR
jgi:hypothetical protein